MGILNDFSKRGQNDQVETISGPESAERFKSWAADEEDAVAKELFFYFAALSRQLDGGVDWPVYGWGSNYPCLTVAFGPNPETGKTRGWVDLVRHDYLIGLAEYYSTEDTGFDLPES
jgi:hypothetical protein